MVKLWSLSRRKKWLLTNVFLVLITYRGLLILFPFKRFIMSANGSVPRTILLSEELINEVIWAVHLISSRIPLGFTCLIQALAVKRLLKNQLDVHVCIGVRKCRNELFSAHAWVAYQNKIILGEQSNQVFEPILEWN